MGEAFDRESIMKRWDKWREYIAEGGKGSWPRDEFEALLDYLAVDKHNRYDAMESALKRVILWCGDWSIAQEIKRMCEEALNGK